MQTSDKTIDHGTLKRLVDAGANVGAAVAGPTDKRSVTASERMKRAHQAAAYDTWFRKEVQASIDDPRESIDDDEVRKQFAAKRAALSKRARAAKKASH